MLVSGKTLQQGTNLCCVLQLKHCEILILVRASRGCPRVRILPLELESWRVQLNILEKTILSGNMYFVLSTPYGPPGIGVDRQPCCKTRHLRELGNQVIAVVLLCVFCGNHERW